MWPLGSIITVLYCIFYQWLIVSLFVRQWTLWNLCLAKSHKALCPVIRNKNIQKKFFFSLFYNQEIGARTDGSYLLLPLNSYWNISFSLSLILFLCVSGNNLQTKDDLHSRAKTRFWFKPLLLRLVCIKYFNETEVPHHTQSVSILSVQKATKTVRGVMRLNYGVLSIFSK